MIAIPNQKGGAGKASRVRLRGVSPAAGAVVIPIDRIGPDPDQPRKDFDPESLDRLAASLKAYGQLQPIRVRWSEGRGQYVIICGERRWRAALIAGLASLVCIVEDRPLSADELATIQMVENCAREDLAPMEQASAMKALLDREGWTQERLADELGVSRPTVARSVGLLGLPDAIRERVARGELNPSVARELARVEDPAALEDLASQAVKEGWTRSEAQAQARFYITVIQIPDAPGADPDPDPDPDEAPDRAKEGPKKSPRPGSPTPSPAGAVPDWRDTPVQALGLPPDLARRLADSEIESAGEAWALCNSAYLVGELGWTSEENWRLSRAFRPILKAAGESGPGPGSPIQVGSRDDGEGGGGDGDPGFGPMPKPAPASAWRKTRFAPTVERVVCQVGGLEVVLRSSARERPEPEQLAALRDAVAHLEGKGGGR